MNGIFRLNLYCFDEFLILSIPLFCVDDKQEENIWKQDLSEHSSKHMCWTSFSADGCVV